jgi:phosphoribosylaminoimidazole-succinocarboxamide synthase
MDSTPALLQTDLPLPRRGQGKVRDLYDLGDRLLIVATDRLSAFDVVLPTGIPRRGEVLTRLSAWWFAHTAAIVPNHLISIAPDAFGVDMSDWTPAQRHAVRGRAMLVHKTERIDFECVVRGYLAGSAWAEYRASADHSACGVRLPPGLRESERLPEPIFTPATKAASGHDENIPFAVLADRLGVDLAARLRDASLALYRAAAPRAEARGILLADTKFEFGLRDGTLLLIDEALTPDSSRFWDAARTAPGQPQASYDKQYVRDWLLQTGWNREPPAPALPPAVVAQTAAKYWEAYTRLTGLPVPPPAQD